jgi:hypothetical protein
MGFLGSLFGGKAGVPEWASALSEAEYRAFAEQLSRALTARSLPADVRKGKIAVTVDGQKASVGFDTLSRRCKVLPAETWPREISEYLDIALTSQDAVLAVLAKDFGAARGKLRVQLVPEGFVRPDWSEGLNYVRFGSGIHAALVYDLPSTVTTVPAEHLRGWKRSWEDVLGVATENVRAEIGVPTPEQVDLGDAIVQQLVGDSYFVCSYALWLDTVPGASSERGALVSVPSRHTVLYHPIRDASAWRVMSALPVLSRDLFDKLPGTLSPNLFWICRGQVIDVPVSDAGGQLQVMPSKALCDAMAGLA